MQRRQYNPGPNIDFYALGMIFLGISTTVGSVNFIVTLLRTRAPGMSINRMPILVWGTLTASVGKPSRGARGQPGVLPALARPQFRHAFLRRRRRAASRCSGSTSSGCSAHPWVYAIVLPAMGMVSDGLPIFCRRPLVGYTLVALATVATMVARLRRLGAPHVRDRPADLALSFFSGVSIIIAIPSAVAVFAWIATIWTGRPVFTTAFLFFAGFDRRCS